MMDDSKKEVQKRKRILLPNKKSIPQEVEIKKVNLEKEEVTSKSGSEKTSSLEDPKRKKSVSFNDKKTIEVKRFSIEAEIKKRSLDAEKKSVPFGTSYPSPAKRLSYLQTLTESRERNEKVSAKRLSTDQRENAKGSSNAHKDYHKLVENHDHEDPKKGKPKRMSNENKNGLNHDEHHDDVQKENPKLVNPNKDGHKPGETHDSPHKDKKNKKKGSLGDGKKVSIGKTDHVDHNKHHNSHDENSNEKMKGRGTKKKSIVSHEAKNLAKKGKGDEHHEDHELTESQKDKLKAKKKSVHDLKDKAASSKTKKNPEDDDDNKGENAQPGKNEKHAERKDSQTHYSGKPSHYSEKQAHTRENRDVHVREHDHEYHQDQNELSQDEEEHHHHLHHRRHSHSHHSRLKKRLSVSEDRLGHSHTSDSHNHHQHHSNEDETSEPHSHSHHHHHHKGTKGDTKHHLHSHVHKTKEQRTWVTEMRGYSSEPVLPLPFEKKFTKLKEKVELKPYMKKLNKKYLSMDDIFLSHDGYPKLLKEEKDESGIKTYAVREEMLRSWDELFEMERQRYSFFDELFAQGYVLDSLEIPSDPSDRSRLVAAEDSDMRSNLEFGRAVFKTKNIYTGEFKDKHFDGIGRYHWVDGTIYQGHFKKGIMHGHGKIEWEDGSLYEGEFVDGIRAGWGIYSTMEGYTYVGCWQNGLPHGPGKMWYDIQLDNSDYYDGNWMNGVQEGIGTRQYANRDRYIGKFTGGVRNGKGTMIWLKERQVYKGNWTNGVPHGLGTHIWYLSRTSNNSFPARHIYRGQWYEGKRDGIGKMIYPCGSIYEGRWKDGQRFAKGLFVNPAGELLVGLFRAGSVCGGTEVPLHAPPYECDYGALIEWINIRFKLDPVENIDQKLYKIVTRHLELFRKLYKRAGQLGQSWGNNGLFPSWLKTGHMNEHDDYEQLYLEDPPHMRGKDKKPLTPDNVYPVFRFGLWLLIKDISGLLDPVTMAHYDKLWSDCGSLSFQTRHNPFEPVYLWQFLQCLVIVAVSYYVDTTNRKFKLRTILEERKNKVISTKQKIHLKKTKSPSPVPIVETKGEIIDPCLKYMRDHHLLENEDEFEDNEEEEEGTADTVGEGITESFQGFQMSESEMDYEDETSTEKRKMTMKERYEKYYEGEMGGEGYTYTEKEFSSIFEFKQETGIPADDDDDNYSSISDSSNDSRPSVENDDEEELPLTIAKAFEKLINDKLINVLKRPPGKHLPKVPDPLPSISDLYISFKAVNNSDVITGVEFLKSTVPHDMFPYPNQTLHWHRIKEPLSNNTDLESLLKNFDSLSFNNPSNDEENTLGEEFLGSTINIADSFTPKMKNEAEPEFERSHRTTVEILKPERKNFVFNHIIEENGENNNDGRSTEFFDTFRRERFANVSDPEEMFTESNPFDDEDLAKEPFLYTQTKTCERVQRKSFCEKWLGAHDVTKIFRRLYPKLSGAHHKSNIPSQMIFCDWLWCISLCARISADREYLTVIKDHQAMRPRMFHTAPHIGIHSPSEMEEKWKHRSVKIGNSLYYLGEKKELQHVK